MSWSLNPPLEPRKGSVLQVLGIARVSKEKKEQKEESESVGVRVK